MKRILFLIFILLFIHCGTKEPQESPISKNWKGRQAQNINLDSLEYGKSYLSIYSQVYSYSEKRIHNLTSLISIRNTSDKDTIYLLKAEHFDTKGTSIKDYVNETIYLGPLETLDILLSEDNGTAGTGNNFIFEWKTPQNCPEPLFEAVMNSTLGQQGLSFTTQGKRIE